MKLGASLGFSVFLILMIFLSCGSSEKQEIQNLLSQREKAIETKDSAKYADCISKNYNETKDGKKVSFDDIRKSFENNTKIFNSIEITSTDVNIYMKDNNTKADVYQKSQYRLTIANDTSRYTAVEELELQKVEGKWKIIKESNIDLFKAFAFGSSG